MSVYLAALGDDGVDYLGLRPRVVRRAYRAAAADRPCGVEQVYERGREHIHVRVPEARYRADVAPVALEAVRPQLFARGEHVRDDVLAEVLAGIWVILVGNQILAQLLPIEYVYAHRSQIALRVLGLLLKLADVAVLAKVHDAEARRLVHRDLEHGYRTRGVMLKMLAQHVGVVHLVDVVAGEDEHVFGVVVLDEADVLVNCVSGAGEP